MKKQTVHQHRPRRPEGLLRSVSAYSRARLERRSEFAKQSSPMLAAFQRAYGEVQK